MSEEKPYKTNSIQSLGLVWRCPGLYEQEFDLAEVTEGLITT